MLVRQRAPAHSLVLRRTIPRGALRQIHAGTVQQSLLSGSARLRSAVLLSQQAVELSARLRLSVGCALRSAQQRSRARVVRLPARTAALYVPNYEAQSGEPVEPDKMMPCPAKSCWLDGLLRIPEGGLLQVPWGVKTIVQVMAAWFAAFLIVGHWGLPALAAAAGLDRFALTDRGLAVYSLCTDVAEMFVGLGVIAFALRRHQPLPPGWFAMRLEGWRRWLRDVLICCAAFPAVSGLSRLSSEMLPLAGGAHPVWDTAGPLGADPVAGALYALVVSLFAPIWEEAIFRGFLLPSVARYMSIDKAIALSAVVFAAAHFSAERLLPLALLGCVMGALYVRSRTLLAPIILHSLWNAFALAELLIKW